jgi:hypothetical protein
MVFPNKYSTHKSNSTNFPNIHLQKEAWRSIKKRKKEVAQELSSKKKLKSSMSLVSQGNHPSENKELHLRPYFLPKLET